MGWHMGSPEIQQDNPQPGSWMAKGTGREEKFHLPILLFKCHAVKSYHVPGTEFSSSAYFIVFSGYGPGCTHPSPGPS